MGRSAVNKRNNVSGGGENETTFADHKNPYQCHDKPKQQTSVKALMEKLKYLRPFHDDILKLESVKTVISALRKREDVADDSQDANSCKRSNLQSTDSQDKFQSTSYLASSDPQASSKVVGRVGGGGGNKQSCNSDNNFVSDYITSQMKNPRGKMPKYNSNSDSTSSTTGVSNPLQSSDIVGSSNSSVTSSSVVYAKKGFATLIRKFEHFYKRVAKKYFFMLRPRKPSKSNFFGVFFSILAFIFYFELHTINGFSRLWLKWENVDLSSVECTIESPNLAMELFRPPVSCAICHDVRSVDRVSGISPTEFERVYAYTGRPVIVTDAMTNWTAPTSFSFEFFKGIYSEGSRSLVHLDEDCLFFPYQTEFGSLAEVFNMTKERSQRPWYIGWSNCDAETSHILRHHYQRPYFLPETAESTHADWIFMGTPGHGAHMHIDHVINPSWQGQIKGFKRWHLQPPPECLYECHSFHVDVHPGDIIVLDTNKWYHQTEILGTENSITIGSEYD